MAKGKVRLGDRVYVVGEVCFIEEKLLGIKIRGFQQNHFALIEQDQAIKERPQKKK